MVAVSAEVYRAYRQYRRRHVIRVRRVSRLNNLGVAPYVKQIPRDGRVEHDMEEFPENLRVREFPTVEAAS